MTLLPFDTRGAWRRYTTADGLAAQQTEHIGEDGDGYPARSAVGFAQLPTGVAVEVEATFATPQ